MKFISPSLQLSILLLLGLCLRLYDLDGESIWVDEGHAIYVASSDLNQLIEESSRDNNPPLYSIILHYWMILTPHTIFFLRFLSVIFGVLSIFLIYEIGKAIFDQKVGIISALFLTLSVFHIHFSQEIRSYMLAVVLILLTFYYLQMLINKPKIIYFLVYIIFCVLLLYTHFLGWFILFAQNIYYLLRLPFEGKRFKHIIITDVFILLLYLPWFNITISRVSDLQVKFWVQQPTLLTIPQTLLIYAGTYTYFGVFLLAIFAALILIGLFYFQNRHIKFRLSESTQNYLLLLWFLLPILLPFVISYIYVPVYITRITIGASLAFYLLAANGLKYIHKDLITVTVLIIIIVFSIGNCSIYYSETNKEPWQEVTHYVESNAQSGDLLIFNAGFCLDKAFNYYAKRNDLEKIPFPEIGREINQSDLNELNSLLSGKKCVWLILSHSSENKELIIDRIRLNFDLIENKEYWIKGINSHFPFVAIELFRFERS